MGAGWRHAVAAWRDGLVARPGFRAWAARFPLTRPIARRRAQALFDIVAGFTYSQILMACVQLDVFERLATGPQTAAALGRGMGLTEQAADRLMAAATALRLVERRGRAYGLGPLGGAMVDNPAVAAMVRHHAALYSDLADPAALFRAGQGALAGYWPYAGAESPAALGAEAVAAYSELMAASQPLVAAEVLDAYDVRRHRMLMDVGGGDGRFLLAARERAPALRLLLFDLPAVAARAATRFESVGDAEAVGGDAFRDGLPAGADLISLVRVVHDHEDDAVLVLLRAARAALAPGGVLLLAEPMSGHGSNRVGDVYFGCYLLAMGRGTTRTPARLRAMLHEAGFRSARVRRTATPMQTGLIVARA